LDQPSTTAAIAQANLTVAGLLATARTQCAENKVLVIRPAKFMGIGVRNLPTVST
jgi:hypothetical protein